MEGQSFRDLREMAWFERQIDANISCIHLDGERLIVGDWDGGIHCWDLNGENLWSTKTSNRVGNLTLSKNMVYAVCGRDLTAIELSTGTIQWNSELEGSSDLVASTQDGSTIIATSSIFDLEMNDFLESTIWRFNQDGDLLFKESIDERPWSIEMRGDGTAFLALGRPRCGMIRINEEGARHMTLPTNSPATCGRVGPKYSIIGHADGTLTGLDTGLVLDDDDFTNQPGPIEAISSAEIGYMVASSIEDNSGISDSNTVRGIARSYDAKGKLVWQIETIGGCIIEHVEHGPEFDSSATAWVVSWDKTDSTIIVNSATQDRQYAIFSEPSRVNAIQAYEDFIAIGFDNGRLILLQGELLHRRLSQKSEDHSDERRNKLAEKLRRLRS